MTAPVGADFELQKAIVAILAASTDLKSLIGTPVRLYQQVPASVVFPYVTIGESQDTPDLAECIDGREIYPVLHIWSRSSSFAEAKSIAATIRAALNGATLSMTENRCIIFEPDELGDQSLRDPDGTTLHIASHYRALCEPV